MVAGPEQVAILERSSCACCLDPNRGNRGLVAIVLRAMLKELYCKLY